MTHYSLDKELNNCVAMESICMVKYASKFTAAQFIKIATHSTDNDNKQTPIVVIT